MRSLTLIAAAHRGPDKIGILSEIRPIENLGDQPLEYLVISADKIERVVRGGKNSRRTGIWACVSVPLRVFACQKLLHRSKACHQDSGIEQRHLKLLTFSSPLASKKGKKDRIGRHHRC